MTIFKYSIRKKLRKPGSVRLVSLKRDFLLEQEGVSSEKEILNNKSLSLYCIDHEDRLAVFVQTKAPFSMVGSAFLYESQYTLAEKVFTVPYEEFFSIAKKIDCPMENICLLFSVGRCGSTLLHKMFGMIPTVKSVSEPDVYSQVDNHRANGQMTGEDASEILKCATRFLWHSTEVAAGEILFVKLRSEVIRSWGDLTQAIPTKRLIFMYRNATDVVQSFNRILGPNQESNKFWHQIPLLSSIHKWRKRYALSKHASDFDSYVPLVNGITPIELLVKLGSLGEYFLWWLAKVDAYMKMREDNLPIIAIRYEDLTSRPSEIFKLLLDSCGLPATELDTACDQIQFDSQQGTQLARNRQPYYYLAAKERETIQSSIVLYTKYSGSNHIFAGTLGHS